MGLPADDDRSCSRLSVPFAWSTSHTDLVRTYITSQLTHSSLDSRSEPPNPAANIHLTISDNLYLWTSLCRLNHSDETLHRCIFSSSFKQTISDYCRLLHPYSCYDFQHHVFLLSALPVRTYQLPLVQVSRWDGALFEEPYSRKCHICSLCYVCHYRLVVWDPTNLLSVENADESPNETIRDPGPVSWILVGVPLSTNWM